MAQVTFTFRAGTSAPRRAAVLREIGALPGVRTAAALKADATSEAVRRLCFAEVEDAAATALLKALDARAEIESAELPAKRGALR